MMASSLALGPADYGWTCNRWLNKCLFGRGTVLNCLKKSNNFLRSGDIGPGRGQKKKPT